MERIDLSLSLYGIDRMNMIRKYHISDTGERNFLMVEKVVETAIRPTAYCELDKDRYLTVITLGDKIDQIIEDYCAKELLTEAYLADCFGMYFLEKAYEKVLSYLEEKTGKSCSMAFPTGDQVFAEIMQIMEQVPQTEVRMMKNAMLTPSKSVVCYVNVKKDETCTQNDTLAAHQKSACENCDRTDCPNRKRTNMTYGYQRIFGKNSLSSE